MKGLFFSSRSLSMSPPDQLADERHKSKMKHREEYAKSSPRPKFKREKLSKNSETKTDSTFQRCKKLVTLKKFSAQDRLKRIRSNVPLQNKIIDQVCLESNVNTRDESENAEINRNARDLNENVKISREPSPQVCSSSLAEVAAQSMPKSRYSADSRLKKIRAAFLKKIMNKKPAEPKAEKNMSDECHSNTNICSVSSDEKCCEQVSSDGMLEFERANLGKDSCMDIDQECDFSREVPDNADSKIAHEENTVSSTLENSYTTKKICEFRNDRAYLALHESFAPDIVMNLAVPLGDVFIVIDTNILLSHLSFVRQLLINDIPPYKSPIVVIPWLVLQEIDYAIKKNDAELVPRAKAANIFLFDYLKKKHPRLFGQSLEDFKQTYKNAVSIDDYILQYCLKFISLEKNVILLTDDINLCNKSMVNNLTVFTRKEFERNFFVTKE